MGNFTSYAKWDYVYDLLPQAVTTITIPNNNVWTFAYDAKGNMTSRDHGAAGTFSQSFDQENRLVMEN